MYLYLLKNEDKYKIGLSKHPHKRVKQLQTGNGKKIKLIEMFESKYPTILEKSFHNIYQLNRMVGEWFELPREFESTFLKECARLEETICNLKSAGNEFV